jgi:hypothetical protein
MNTSKIFISIYTLLLNIPYYTFSLIYNILKPMTSEELLIFIDKFTNDEYEYINSYDYKYYYDH